MRCTVPSILALAIIFAATTTGQAQVCVEPVSGLFSWWTAEGTSLDSAGDNDGTLQNGAGFTAGMVGSAFLLDGIDDYVLVPHDPTLDVQQITLEGWIQTTQADNHFIASKSGSTGLFGYEIGVHTSGRGRFTLNGAADNADVFGPVVISDGQFHHVAGTYDGERLKIYVDGALVARSLTTTAVLYETDTQFFIGARELGGIPGYWPGAIDELTIYSRPLCGAEIAAIYDAGSAGKCDGGTVVTCPILVDDFDLGDTGEWSQEVQ